MGIVPLQPESSVKKSFAFAERILCFMDALTLDAMDHPSGHLTGTPRHAADDPAFTTCAVARAAVLFESEESLLRDAVKRRQTADCEQELSTRLRQESGYYYQDPFESRRGLRGRSL